MSEIQKPTVRIQIQQKQIQDLKSKRIRELETENKYLEEALTEIALENDSVFPKMRHCKVCNSTDVDVTGHDSNCKYEQALERQEG